jgi:hypothetical protein
VHLVPTWRVSGTSQVAPPRSRFGSQKVNLMVARVVCKISSSRGVEKRHSEVP